MTSPLKVILFAVGGVLGVLALVALVSLLILGANSRKQVQAFASEALGMEVSIGDRPDIGFFPGLHIAMKNVQIRSGGAEVASAAQALLGIELFALLHNEIRMNSLDLRHVKISIERQRDGRFNFETRSGPVATFLPADGGKVSFSDATLLYTDRQSGHALEANACNLDGRHLQLSAKQGASPSTGLSFAATLACGQIKAKDLIATDVKSAIDLKDGILNLKPITMHLFGGQGTGEIRADFSGTLPGYQVGYALSQFQLAELFKTMDRGNLGNGLLDFAANLSMQGRTTDEMVRSVGGDASLRGHDLTLAIGDIDKSYARYESSQSINLVDVGALFFAGPFGLVVTKGYSFARILGDGSGANSHIRTLVSEWSVQRGMAHAKDVAMATQQNRIALKGELDFVNERFKDVTVALIDPQGCPRVQQKIRGTFAKPEVEEPSVVTTLSGSVRELLGKARDLFGGHCEVFYAGSVAAPASSKP